MVEPTQRGRHEAFFDRARTLARDGDFDVVTQMYLEGLLPSPDSLHEHQELRTISLHRKANGGMSLGLFETMKLKAVKRGPVDRMLAFEKLLCYDPGNVDHMLAFGEAAAEANASATVRWVRELIDKAQEFR